MDPDGGNKSTLPVGVGNLAEPAQLQDAEGKEQRHQEGADDERAAITGRICHPVSLLKLPAAQSFGLRRDAGKMPALPASQTTHCGSLTPGQDLRGRLEVFE